MIRQASASDVEMLKAYICWFCCLDARATRTFPSRDSRCSQHQHCSPLMCPADACCTITNHVHLPACQYCSMQLRLEPCLHDSCVSFEKPPTASMLLHRLPEAWHRHQHRNRRCRAWCARHDHKFACSHIDRSGAPLSSPEQPPCLLPVGLTLVLSQGYDFLACFW